MSPHGRFRPGERVRLADGRTVAIAAWAAEGSHALVYRAGLEPGGETVAVKLARLEVGCAGALLAAEAEILGGVTHPHLAGLLGSGNGAGAPFLVLEWLDGETLRERWEQCGRRMAVRDALALVEPLLGGIETLHATGRRHGDVRMENVILTRRGPVLFDPLPPSPDPEAPSPRDDVTSAVELLYRLLGGREEAVRPLPGFPADLNGVLGGAMAADAFALRQRLAMLRDRL